MDIDLEFLDIIGDHSERTGFQLPVLVSLYISQLLETKIENSNLILEPKISDCIFPVNKEKYWLTVKTFADQCLFYSSLDPVCNDNNFALAHYWATVGQQAYREAGNLSNNELFYYLAEWFIPLQQFIASMVHGEVSAPGLEIFTQQNN